MSINRLAIFTVLWASLLAPVARAARVSGHTGSFSRADAVLQTALLPASLAVDAQGAGEEPQHITVVNPTPATPAWSLHEKIGWAAELVLVVLGYAGVLMALSLLKKIDRQTAYAEVAAEAASSAAQAALLNAQAILHAERPWILITIEPSRSAENSFSILATNRGRTPARIVSSLERKQILIDEHRLPPNPTYEKRDRNTHQTPVILLPGESTAVLTFSRNDVKGLCDSEERFRRIETWEEKVYLYGRVVYQDLIAPAEQQEHETNWCCWYIHGRQSSGLVMAGPPEYNAHT